jgi:nicotinamide mononucleotide transporter
VDVFCTWLTSHGSSCLELVGAVIGVVSVLLSVRENVWSWPTALVNVALYSVLFFKTGLYSEMGLQVVYFILSVYGWYEWLYGGRGKTALTVTRTPLKRWPILAVIAVVFWIVDGTAMSHAPGVSLPYVDASLVAISLVAQYLMTKKYLENWALWIVVDVAYVAMFTYKGLVLTAANYAVYLGLAVAGHIAWTRSGEQTLVEPAR